VGRLDLSTHPFLYYITDRTALARDETTRRKCLLEKISGAARAGVDYIQLREKDLSTRELESLAREAVAVLHEIRSDRPALKTKLLINSRADIALAVAADGVHLRSDDVSPEELRDLWAKSNVGTAALGCLAAQSPAATDSVAQLSPQAPLVGVSCHSTEEVAQAEAKGATFAVFAPVFEKKGAPAYRPTGLSQLREACKAKVPVLALGGITIENAQSCLEAGASGIAAIRLFQENDIVEIADQLRRSIR
jgi:thiamine-phosphate pyrophosphorylase